MARIRMTVSLTLDVSDSDTALAPRIAVVEKWLNDPNAVRPVLGIGNARVIFAEVKP